MGRPRKDYSGNVYGDLKILHFVRMENWRALWLCECVHCGRRRELAPKVVVSGHARKCECRPRKQSTRKLEDITGVKVGRLTAPRFVEFRQYSGAQRAFWEFLCGCGNTKVLSASNVVGNH